MVSEIPTCQCTHPVKSPPHNIVDMMAYHSCIVILHGKRDLTDEFKIHNYLTFNSLKRRYSGWVWPSKLRALKTFWNIWGKKESLVGIEEANKLAVSCLWWVHVARTLGWLIKAKSITTLARGILGHQFYLC